MAVKNGWIALGTLSAVVAASSSSGSVLSRTALFARSDVVVRAEGRFYVDPMHPLIGVLHKARVLKGVRRASYTVEIEQSNEADEVPTWRPLYSRVHGTFFLATLPNGHFCVLALDEAR